MSNCQRCDSTRVLEVNARCRDQFWAKLPGMEAYEGYVPAELCMGGGDDIFFSVCLDCGQVRGKYPLPKLFMEFEAEPEALSPADLARRISDLADALRDALDKE